MPVRKSIPYVVKPEEIIPGVPNYYASSYNIGGAFHSILVKTREGRPILVEGNPHSTITQGGISSVVAASVLGVYDNARIRNPKKDGEDISWATADKEIKEKLQAISDSGKKIAILSSTVNSPSTLAAIAKFTEAFPGTEHIMYDAVSYSGMLDANETTFGLRGIPDYHFDKADVIVSIGADFLGSWVASQDYSPDYIKNRQLDPKNPKLSRHIQIEGMMSLTGSNADERVAVMPSHLDPCAVKLYNLIAGKAGMPTVPEKAGASQHDEKLKAIADELWAAKGKSIVVFRFQ